MTPIGHISISLIIWRAFQKLNFKALLLGAILPDIDFIFIFFSWFNSIHRIWTHNLLFLIFSSIILKYFFKNEKKNVFLSLMLGGISHLLIDSMLDSNPSNGIGIAWFFPFSNFVYSPYNFISEENFSKAWDIKNGNFASNLFSILIEVPFYIIAAVIVKKKLLNKN